MMRYTESQRIIAVIDKIVSTILIMKCKRISNNVIQPETFITIEKQSFGFYYGADFAIARCFIEFECTTIDEGMLFSLCRPYLHDRKGKIFDHNYNLVFSADNLVDVYNRPLDHPLNQLFMSIWDKEDAEATRVSDDEAVLEKLLKNLR